MTNGAHRSATEVEGGGAGQVGPYWAASESGLRPSAVGGEGDQGAREDFCGRAWPNRNKGLFIFRI
jgi:hypothetical protein